MKTLAFNDDAGLTVSYITDRIDGHDLFTVYQIIVNKDGVTHIGVTDEVISKLYYLDLAMYSIKQFCDKAVELDVNLIEFSEEYPDPVYLVGSSGAVLGTILENTTSLFRLADYGSIANGRARGDYIWRYVD